MHPIVALNITFGYRVALQQFLTDLAVAPDEPATVDFCRRRILHGTPFVFHDREDEYYSFRKRVSDKYNISFHEIYIVGSAKLGFSPMKKSTFDYNSDIDVAIVSQKLFYFFMEKIHYYQMGLRTSRRTIQSREIDSYHKFLEYVAIGWIRPDLLPLSFQVEELKKDWFDFFNSLSYGRSEVGNYKVSAGVFRDYIQLERYTLDGLVRLQKSLRMEKQIGDAD